jgi:hypothetical protein
MGSCAEGMSVADIDMQVLEDAEANYQIRADLGRDDWHYDYRHSNSNTKDNEDDKVKERLWAWLNEKSHQSYKVLLSYSFLHLLL